MRKFLILAMGLALLAPTTASAQSGSPTPMVRENETIVHVTGHGRVSLPPETARIAVGVTTTGETSMEALATNNHQTAALVDAIREAGITGRDVRTSDLTVEPQFAEGEDRITGWRATNTLTVRTANLDALDELVGALFEAGGNTVNTPEFGLTDATRLRATRDAEGKALAEARDQANSTASALDMRVARVLLVSDSTVNFAGGSRYITVTGNRIGGAAVPIEPGEIDIDATYSVEFALVPE